MPAFDEVLEDLNQSQSEINDYVNHNMENYLSVQAKQHFFSNEVIMVYEYSTTILDFLISAKKNNKFDIINVETESGNLGQQMANQLGAHGINVTVIPFSNSFALMQRVNKLVLGVDAILKNGGLLMHPGTYLLCLAAHQFSVPVIALSGTHKLTPKYAFEQNTFNQLLSPLEFLQPRDVTDSQNNYIAVKYDYVPPEYITLYITNSGQFTPQNIYQQFNDFYDAQDEDI